jgi:hypothetical protein
MVVFVHGTKIVAESSPHDNASNYPGNFIGSWLKKFMLRQIQFTRAQMGSLIVRIGSLTRRFFHSEV